MVSTTVQTILDNLTSPDNWTLAIGAAENASLLNLTNSSFVPKINGFDDGPQFPAYIRTPSMVLCSIILCIGVLGNIMVPCVILKSKDMRNSTNIFLMNLSIADLMVLLVCTPTVLVEVNSKPETWQMGEHMLDQRCRVKREDGFNRHRSTAVCVDTALELDVRLESR
ncbi:neuropeptide Y receptor type 1-like [Diaphorina citri]|uniref:Neuropeptide Y receptor type 1-like n=2 Tax=Diaphorina citri TaxID=121845 RepID=A0A3Q0J1L8_DIACI|nr:neuropeptide Y receptor type 1-like [Diaphorina citri]